MIRRLTLEDKQAYFEMAREFYSSDAVWHSVPTAHFEKTFDEMMPYGQMARANKHNRFAIGTIKQGVVLCRKAF